MSAFFSNTRPGTEVSHGKSAFELPILYFRDDLFALYFSADADRVREILPSSNLHPALLPNGRAIAVALAFNYIETSIGPYGEAGLAIPCVFGRRPSRLKGVLAALMESKYPGFGVFVMHLPVTTQAARDAGRGEWGYTKFMTDMDFKFTPEYMKCRVSEEGKNIMELQSAKKGFYMTDQRPLVTFSVKNNQLIKTVIPQKAAKRISINPKNCRLRLGDHPVAKSIRLLDISSKPFMSCYYPERSGVLPAGKVIQKNVKSFDGYIGKDGDRRHAVKYFG